MTARSGGELAKRVGVALIGIPVAVGLVYLGGYWLAGFLAVLAALAAWEFCRMYRDHGVPAAPRVAGVLAAFYVLLAEGVAVADFVSVAVVVTLVVAATLSIRWPAESRPGAAVITTVFGALYTGLMLAFAVWLSEMEDASHLAATAVVFLPVAITWLGDTAAYFTGKAIGRHKFAPVISPKKTWEGAIGGVLATAAGAVLYLELTRSLVPWTMSLLEVLGFAVLVAVAGQVGDLFESRFKRECEVKDSSDLIPGHGGVLDRLDSLLFVFPVAYVYLSVVGIR